MSESGRANGVDETGVQVTRRRRRVRRAFSGRSAAIAAGGIQVSGDQIVKPLGDRLLTQTGKFMGSTVSPNGRYLAATSADKSVVLQIFDLSSYKEIWSVGTAAGASCDKGGSRVDDVGPGNDWRCVVTWHLPGSTATGSAIYQLDVTPDGRYVARADRECLTSALYPSSLFI